MGQKSVQANQSRVPKVVNGININCCSRPSCINFNIPAQQSRNDPNYTLVGNKKFGSSIQCKACGGYYSVKSNLAVAEELARSRVYNARKTVYRQDGNSCHNIECKNFGHSATAYPSIYKRFGRTSAGNQRFQCLSCKITFTHGSEKRKNHPQSKSHQNVNLFKLLMNGMNINRAMEVTGLSAATIYRKIDMFYERCLTFSYQREENLKGMTLGRMRLSSDRQEYHVNWSARKDKRNVVMTAIGTADKRSRYVFGMDVNYDESVDLSFVKADPAYNDDGHLKDYNRRYARIWTERDYPEGVNAREEYLKRVEKLLDEYRELDVPLPITNVALSYALDKISNDFGVDALEHSRQTYVPKHGCQVRSEYTMYAHYKRLEELLGHAWELRFYLDQEPAINRACALAFSKQVQNDKCLVSYVRINKDLTVDERRVLVNVVGERIKRMIEKGEATSDWDAYQVIMRQSFERPIRFKNTPEDWFSVPIHRINECEKHVSILTSTGSLSDIDKVSIMIDATLAPIDNFFQMVRRRLSSLERPISSRSNVGRVWTGKSPYNPEMIHKHLQIFRTYYNYCFVGKGKTTTTAAERLGLAKGPVEVRKILFPY